MILVRVFTILVALVLSSLEASATLSPINSLSEGVGGTEGLENPQRVLVSPDGNHVYTINAGSPDSTIGIFSRDSGTGAVAFVDVVTEGVDTPDVNGSFARHAMSPDGLHYYVSTFGGALLGFSRDTGTGALTFVEELEVVDDILGLVFSLDGEYVYAPASGPLLVFSRNVPTGALTLVQTIDQSNFVARGARVSPDGAFPHYVYVIEFNTISTFQRSASNGQLTRIDKDIIPPSLDADFEAIEPSPDGGHLYTASSVSPVALDTYELDALTGEPTLRDRQLVDKCQDWKFSGDPLSLHFLPDGRFLAHVGRRSGSGSGDHGVAAFDRDGTTGAVSFLEIQVAEDGDLPPLDRVSDLAISPDGAHAYAIDHLGQTLAAFEVEASPPAPGRDCRLPGTSLVIRNQAGGLLTSIKWSSSGDAESGMETTPEDPRCNGDPSGTVRATLRFASSTSGADTGAIPLPCQNWKVGGSAGTPGRTYSYEDKEQDDGPCRKVEIKGFKVLSANCDNRGPSPLAYLLAPGVDQGNVDAVLTTGTLRHCARLDDYKGADGSDGKTFRGKKQPAPAACPP
ncbi:MAG: lactonase family protein [Deltaproteobacteria bacterium]|nr:lactonase family protein [Deltaproteobacteria bacterium]